MNKPATISPVDTILARVRQTLVPETLRQQNSRRLFHGRGKCYPDADWCCIDYFHPMLLVTLYKEIEPAVEGRLKWELSELLSQLNRVEMATDGPQLNGVIVQRRYIARAPFETWVGEIPEALYAKRYPNRFNLSFAQQNIGYFLDIEPARQWLERHAKNSRVLNLFAYTCAFSVVAVAAGAQRVVNMDLSRKSLAVGRQNHRINSLDVSNVTFFAHDIFKSWGKLRKNGPYDIVIVDPPSYQKGSFIASQDYHRLLPKVSGLVVDGGKILVCLNAPEILRNEFKQGVDKICPEFVFEQLLENHNDFPEAEPERGLKMLVYRKLKTS